MKARVIRNEVNGEARVILTPESMEEECILTEGGSSLFRFEVLRPCKEGEPTEIVFLVPQSDP